MTTPKTLKEAQIIAAEHGILLSEREQEHIQQVQAAARARLIATTPVQSPDMAARFNTYYPRLLKFIVSLGETLLTFAQTLIVSLGVPLVLVLLLIVEHQRVVHGIMLFEQDVSLASFAALALVLLNLVLEFQIHHIEHAAGYQEEQGKRWSLWIWAQNAAYTIGLGEAWSVQYVSPASRYKGLLRLVTFSILALALVGSMRAVIQDQAGPWYQAIGAIVTESTLLLLMTWVGGLLFAAAAVLAAQGLSRYVAIRCVEIISAMSTAQTEAIDPFAADVDQAGALALYTIITAKETAKAERAAKASVNKNHVSVLSEQPQTLEETVVIEPRPFGSTAPGQAEKIVGRAAHVSIPTINQQPVSEYAATDNGNGKH